MAIADVAGKIRWLRAKDLSGTNGSAVTSWADALGTATAAAKGSPTLALAATPNGGKAVSFTGSTFFVVGEATSATAAGFYPGEGPANVLDGDQSTPWTDDGWGRGFSWLKLALGSARTVTGYTLTARSSFTGRNPRDWRLEGSNDNGTTWTTVDTRTGQAFGASEIKTFTVASPGSFAQYRLYITANNGDGGVVHLAEFGLLIGPSAGAEMWVVVKSNIAQDSSWHGLTNLTGVPVITAGSHYPGQDGKVYETALRSSADGRVSYTPSPAVNAWRIYRVRNDGAAYLVTLDGTTQASGTVAGVTLPIVGQRIGSNGSISGDGFLNGQVAEVLVFDHALTSGDATTVRDYLTAEHFDAVPTGTTGTIAGTAPLGVGSLTGTVTAPAITGTIAGTAPAPSGALAGKVPTTGTLAGVGPLGAGALAGSVSSTTTGTLAGSAPLGVGSLAGTVTSAPVTTVVADDFNRANSSTTMGVTSVGAVAWVPSAGSTWGIIGGQAYLVSGSDLPSALVQSGAADCTVSVKMGPVAGDFLGLVLRSNGAGNEYFLQYGQEDSALVIVKRTGGSYAGDVMGYVTVPALTIADVVSVVMSGPTFTVQVNGVTVGSGTDATYSTQTKHGLWCIDGGNRFDDFAIATTVPATPSTIAGVGPMGVGSLVGGTGTTSLNPWVDGAHGEALLAFDCPPGVLEVTYPPSPAPAAIVEVRLNWQSHETATIGGDTSGMVDVPLGVPHVWVDGVDVTYFRNHPTKIAGWRQESPFGWTGTTLTFPQVFHHEERGVGDLAWMRPDAPVEIAIVRPNGTRLHRFTGQLTSDDPGVGRGRTECVWGVEGVLWQAEHAHHEVPARLNPTDVGTLIPAELNGTPSRRFSPIKRVTTGIATRKRGAYSDTRWGYASNLLATATRTDGKQWTLDPTGPRSFRLALKDTSTVHWTVTAGAPGVELDLSADHHERIDAVYGRGVGPDGYAWANLFFPDLLPYDPPDYPYSNPSQNVNLGATDAGTLTGHAISDWQRRIRDLGYTSLAVDGVMGSADIAAVYWIQRKRGIQVDGHMGPQTWAATWNIGAVGGDLDTVRLPLAVRPEVEKYLYGANGATVGRNPVYDPSIIRHEVDVDFGAGVTKEHGRELAQRILERGMDPGVAGTIRLMTCPWEGSRWEINAGDNVLLKGFRGEDVLMRVTALDADPESQTVTLTVDSEFRDAMAVVQVLERNRESKADPARRPGNPNKRSRLDQDMVTPFEGESPAGRLPRMALFGGLWTVWPVPVSEIGEVARLRFWTEGPESKFCVAMFGKPITANQIDAIVPAPLTNSAPWQTKEELLLDRYGWIDTWGKDGQASGYSPGQEGDGPLTGKLTDDAGFPYVSQVAPWVWVAMWSPVSTFIEGRIYPSPVQ